MRKISLALVGGAIVLTATPAFAAMVLLGPYKNRGECNSAVSWADSAAKKGDPSVWYTNGYHFECQQIKGLWYLVAV
jgi:hypothetical protein